jgi:hypothetical protein
MAAAVDLGLSAWNAERTHQVDEGDREEAERDDIEAMHA